MFNTDSNIEEIIRDFLFMIINYESIAREFAIRFTLSFIKIIKVLFINDFQHFFHK